MKTDTLQFGYDTQKKCNPDRTTVERGRKCVASTSSGRNVHRHSTHGHGAQRAHAGRNEDHANGIRELALLDKCLLAEPDVMHAYGTVGSIIVFAPQPIQRYEDAAWRCLPASTPRRGTDLCPSRAVSIDARRRNLRHKQMDRCHLRDSELGTDQENRLTLRVCSTREI